MGGGQAAAGNDTVHVYMVPQFLVPRVKDLDESGCCPEILLVGGKLQKGFGATFMEKPIQEGLVPVEEGI